MRWFFFLWNSLRRTAGRGVPGARRLLATLARRRRVQLIATLVVGVVFGLLAAGLAGFSGGGEHHDGGHYVRQNVERGDLADDLGAGPVGGGHR